MAECLAVARDVGQKGALRTSGRAVEVESHALPLDGTGVLLRQKVSVRAAQREGMPLPRRELLLMWSKQPAMGF